MKKKEKEQTVLKSTTHTQKKSPKFQEAESGMVA
jgi:hypothetical protein